MGLIAYLHSWLDYGLACVKMVQNREVGWLTVDRKTGEYKREQQPLLKKIKLLLLFNPLFEWIDTLHLFRWYLHEQASMEGKSMTKPSSRKKIESFIDFYHINMDEFEPSDPGAYQTFQGFFTRHHKPESRPIYAKDDARKATCPADCRAVVYDTVSQARKIWIKGSHFTISALVQSPDHAITWDNGAVASFRLSPQDYHRYHSPVSGKVKWWKAISGDYYGVDPLCLRSRINVLTQNARCALAIDSAEFGQVLFVAIGAKEVGTVCFSEKARTPGAMIEKGDELGMFEFGGSSIVVVFEQGRIEFDEDLLSVSKRGVQMDVEVGQSLGKAVKI
ncbi:putative phosphatidylserine decarboxylase [Choiromyces venosus 120613-1]|uniref:phosphatidylserine decarboxylase n=1 Tax=Choiromyces venosus 120613-1 TaxID=1336337 RepID=A0A3N4JEI5_9PEZI|nr:putative phosphatidylserine decarboxylase [Choiromyces venosus 120613-1]